MYFIETGVVSIFIQNMLNIILIVPLFSAAVADLGHRARIEKILDNIVKK